MRRFILVLSTLFVLLGTSNGLGHAGGRELFVLPTEGGLEFYLLDGTLHVPSLEVYRTPRENWSLHINDTVRYFQIPGLGKDHPRWQRPFSPGFRISLSGRVMTVAGKIDWMTGNQGSRVAKDGETPSSLASIVVLQSMENSQDR